MAFRILCTGVEGMLGSALAQAAALQGMDFHGMGHRDLDICEPEQLRALCERIKPHILINCAAYRNIDKAEVDREAATLVNAEGPRRLAEISRELGLKLIHFSTHGVFDGTKIGAYLESDPAIPLNHYAATKLEGERAIAELLPSDQFLILRISWPYGSKANNFIAAILEAAKTKSEIRVVSDQIGNPTPVALIASKTLVLMKEGKGLFHLACRGACSRFDLMEILFKRRALACKLVPVEASAFPTVAPRPANMALATELNWMENIAPMPTWQEALEDF